MRNFFMQKHTFIQTLLISSTLFLSAGQPPAADYKTNFYQAVNKQWLDTHTIPADKGSISTFTDIDDLFIKNAKALIATLMKKKNPSADEQKIVDYYSAFVDMKSRNANGINNIKPFFEKIDNAKDYKELAHVFADIGQDAIASPYHISVAANPKEAQKYLLEAGSRGLGLQQKFYEDNSTAGVNKRKNYLDYMADILALAKFDDVNKTVANTMKVEKILAKETYSVIKAANIKNVVHLSAFKTLDTMMNNLDLSYYFKRANLPTDMTINITMPEYFKALNKVYKDIPLDVWKDYLKTHVLTFFSGELSEDFIQANHRYSVKEGMAPKMESLETRALRDTSSTLSFLFGKVYVETYFDEGVKAKVEDILKSILSEYKIAITDTKRFSAETKKAALRKIDKMASNIAYPKKWHDYSTYKTKKDDLLFNLTEMIKLMHKRELDKIKRGTIDKDMWEGYPPQETNAYYDPMNNKFVLLAGILYTPFFDINASDAANYGGIGMVIGHEVGHAFDNTGAQFDEKGNMNNWWTKEDLAKFEKLKDALITQADAYKIVSGVHANGKLEIGEIQADLSGATIALRAYLHTIKDDKAAREKGIRDFFIQFAKIWRSKMLSKLMVINNDTDGHPAAEYRINGTLKNMDAFYKAFDVEKGDNMYLGTEKRVEIW